MANIVKKIIPYNKYFIDSAKFYVDSVAFTSINLPENFTLVASDTGEVISDFKKSSLEIPYKNHKIYISRVKKYLPKVTINKILLYFPAKVSGENYFYGIQKQDVIEVLEFLKSKGYLGFDSSNEIYKKIYVKDLDIKCDYLIPDDEVSELEEYNKILKEKFNGEINEFHGFTNKKKGFGIHTYSRNTSSLAKPFIKFYHKSIEMMKKNQEFLETLPNNLKSEIIRYCIYRYEFTLKDKRFFDNYNISNRLEEVHEVLQEKWIEIGRSLLNKNFQVIYRKPRDLSKLQYKDKVLCLYFLDDIQKGLLVQQIRNKYLVGAKTKHQKYRANQLFEKIYHYASVENVSEMKQDLDIIEKWDKFFGIF